MKSRKRSPRAGAPGVRPRRRVVAARGPRAAAPAGAVAIPAAARDPLAIDRRVLHEAVADRLRDLITEGVLAPGARLNERVLCEHLHVSRTPLREAYKVLAAEGLIRLLPNRGAVVSRLSVDDVVHTFELMAALEALNGELAAARATDDEIRELQRLTREMKAAHAQADLPAYYRMNQAIHAAIAAAARNPVLADVYRTTNARLQALRFRSNLNREKWKAAMREHERIVQALAARDGALLGRLLAEHLAHKRDIVVAQLMDQQAGERSEAAIEKA
jgi:DNA-binding GntR family transcriptional regulator